MFLDLSVGDLYEPVSGRHWDRWQIQAEVGARVGYYLNQGMTAGDRVFLMSGNRLEFFADLLAVWQLGGCAMPIDARLTPFELTILTEAASPHFSIVDNDTGSCLVKTLETSGVKVQNTELISPNSSRFIDIADTTKGTVLDDDALILFTSGSTGDPKGVVHTHRSLRARWVALRQSLGLEAYRRTLCLLPTLRARFDLQLSFSLVVGSGSLHYSAF